jgi:hypothetical protein
VVRFDDHAPFDYGKPGFANGFFIAYAPGCRAEGAMSVVCVIPARYPSVRFPGKPLAMLRGAGGTARSLIERTWRAAQEVDRFDAVYVATDDARIAEASRDFGAEVLMTSDAAGTGPNAAPRRWAFWVTGSKWS